MYKYYFSCAILIFLSSCMPTGKNVNIVEGQNGKILKQYFDANHKLVREEEVTKANDSFITNGMCREYFPSGNIKKLSFKSYNQDTGNYYTFYPSGKTKSLSISTGNSYYTVMYDTNGIETNHEMKFAVKNVDSSKAGKPIPVVINLFNYGGTTTHVSEKLYDSTNKVLWDTSFVESCRTYLCIRAYFHSNVIMPHSGIYKFTYQADHIDNISSINVKTDSASVHFFAL